MAASGQGAAVEGLSTIKAAFSHALSMPVEVLVARDYPALIESHLDGRVDYAIYATSAYAAAWIRCGCLRPIAAPLGIDGSFGMRSVLIVRRPAEDAPLSVAAGPADSLTTRLVPLASWPDVADALETGRLLTTETAGEAETMFLSGAVDAYFGWAPSTPGPEGGVLAGGSIDRLAASGLDVSGFEIEWTSPLLRYGPHAVRETVPDEQFEALQRLLAGVAADADLDYYLGRRHGGGFAAVAHDDYLPVIEALGGLGRMVPVKTSGTGD